MRGVTTLINSPSGVTH